MSTTYPTNAAKIFKWGRAHWVDEFKDPLKSMWAVNRKSQVRNQNGMLTLEAPATGGDTVARLTVWSSVRPVGGSRARPELRRVRYGVPRGLGAHPDQPYHCGARNIVLSDYALGTNRAAMHVRKLPNRDFTASKPLALADNQFHTYAIEVTPDHVSWFVDTKVIRTERRPGARTGALTTHASDWWADPGHG